MQWEIFIGHDNVKCLMLPVKSGLPYFKYI